MKECECLGGCPFFNDKMDKMPAMAAIYKNKYCLDDSTDCARHMVFEVHGSSAVPIAMYPNDREAATRLLAELG